MSSGRPPLQGTSIGNVPRQGELNNIISYQQLLNSNKDLRKEIAFHMDLQERLGEELKRLQLQYGENERLENEGMEHQRGLYEALEHEPALFRYLPSLLPLLEAYDIKCKRFDETCEKLHEQFLIVERKYEEVLGDNKKLRQSLESRISEIIDLYSHREPVSEKMFSNLILDQHKKREELLAQENNLVTSKFKELESKSKQLVEELKQKTILQQNDSKKARQFQESNQLLTQQNQNLKSRYSDLQIRNKQLENKESQLNKTTSRTDFQIAQLNSENEALRASLNKLRAQKDYRSGEFRETYEEGRREEELQKENYQLRAQITATKAGSQTDSLMKKNEELNRELNQLKEFNQDLKQQKIILNKQINDLKSTVSRLESETNILRTKEGQLNKSLQEITEKNKIHAERQLGDYTDKLRRAEGEYQSQLEERNNKIRELREQCEKLKLEKENMEREISMINSQDQSKVSSKGRELSRQLERRTEEIKNSKERHEIEIDQLHNQIKVMRQDLIEYERLKENSSITDKTVSQLHKEVEMYKMSIEKMTQEKKAIIDEMKEIKAIYEAELAKKESHFNQKIEGIRKLIAEAVEKERLSKQAVKETSNHYQEILQEIKKTYADRIKALEKDLETLRGSLREAQTYKKVTRVKQEII